MEDSAMALILHPVAGVAEVALIRSKLSGKVSTSAIAPTDLCRQFQFEVEAQYVPCTDDCDLDKPHTVDARRDTGSIRVAADRSARVTPNCSPT